jgi:two-component system cell cycle response regulator
MKIGRFLVLDPQPESQRWIARELTARNCGVVCVETVAQAIQMGTTQSFDAVLVIGDKKVFDDPQLDLLLADYGDGVIPSTCLRVAACIDLSTVDQTALMRRGFSDVIPLPVYLGQLMLRLRSLSRLALMQRELNRRQRTMKEFMMISEERDLSLDFGTDSLLAVPLRPRVMVIDMQKEQIPNKWGSLLETFAEPLVVRNFDEAQAVLYSGEADATIIDLKSTVDDALIFVASLRSTAQFYNHPVLLNISDERELSLERTFSAGINDLFVGNMQVEDVKARVSALLRHERLRKHLSEECDSSGDSLTRDSLCGLFTFGFGMAHLQQLELDMRRINQPVTLAMLHFTSLPSINSQFGYAAGDSILRQVALIVRNCLRGEDVCVRYSGRTMMLVFPEIAQDDATVAINRLLSILRYTMFVLPQADSSLPIQFEHSLTEWMPGEDIQQAIARLDLGPTIRSKAA